MRAPDRAVLTIQHQRHGQGDNQRWPVAADRARAATPIFPQWVLRGGPGASFAPVSKELEAAGAAFLSSPPSVFPLAGKCSFPRGAFRAFRASFFSCSVTGKLLAATTAAGCAKNADLTGPCIRVDCNRRFGSRTKGASTIATFKVVTAVKCNCRSHRGAVSRMSNHD